ncbi:MAG TPA: bifunctional (p)ppGpp synthetase/guanosine-3',5'-bis(diphosphate) 3'-pyrophosphohydrolase [Burkholderiales bacterium]|jgi:GTP diphosphokinase / guanosine-3',5'-bis(diphosphate) 3'-diphosphatase|nr:bifunctional (p)ppGpp synthetase/guanosine-3',5'-bis(diphosphate) 3'-pyrophosphohydrolase [Burkholderiales bacterium]
MATAVVPNLEQGRFGYLKPKDVARLAEAYRFSEAAHAGQTRQSGDPYISHPLAVAEILADWHLDGQTLIAALLHDVTEDTSVTKDEISDTFGKPVAELVDGVSKLDKIEFQSAEVAQAENFRKMLLAMARDVRIILIKLADRLHNMRTLGAVPPAKRKRVARETMEIYAPIALRLGLNTLYHELQELAFSHLHPLRYLVLAKATKAARGNRREMIGRTLEAVKKKLADSGIEGVVQGREKHVYSTYRKMIDKHLSFSEVHDIFGIRVIVKDVPSCYLALGALHALYKPIPGKFKDYIAIPKANGYQSIHTDLIGPYGVPVEVQTRTEQMHRLAESGVASHWMYKDDSDRLSELQKQTHQWLQSLLEIQHQSGDPQEFLEHVKVDLFPDEVYVFTPKGKILSLPRGATAVDFAYAVHTDIGNRCVAAKVNGELVPLRTDLRNGDRVEIITASHAKPNPGWLQYVRTGKARSNIRHFLKTMQYEESASLGERLLEQALKALKGSLAEIDDAGWDRALRDSGARSRGELLADIGLGKRLPAVVARRLLKRSDSKEELKSAGSVTIRGTEGMAVQLASCCRPIPGDAIVGSIKKGQGLVVHVSECTVIERSRKKEPEQWIDVEWDPRTSRLFQAAINVTVENQRGVLAKVASEIASAASNIDAISMDEDRALFTTMHLVLEVANRQHLARVLRALRRLPDVKKISRTRE